LDVLVSIAFYFCAGLALAGALASALSGAASPWRAAGLFAVAIGTAGVLASLSAGFAALVNLVCLTGAALLLGGRRGLPATGRGGAAGSRMVAQVGAVVAAVLFGVLAYAAVRGSFVRGSYPGGWFGAAAVGRLFFSRDAMALQAVGFSVLVAFAGVAYGRRERRP
jgi:NADH:ubiquinone oxidoreductase subunit 6 (subunit J)